MGKTIDMQFMRYINLFEGISRISTTDCFIYNNTIYFAVKPSLLSKAVGKNGANVRQISETLRKRVRVISMPAIEKFDNGSSEEKNKILKNFILEVVSPMEFTTLDYVDSVVSISGSREQKAMMIGRDRSKQVELQEVLSRTFGVKELKFI